MPTVTEQLSEFVARTVFDDLDEQAVLDTKRIICDTVGGAIGGVHLEAGRLMAAQAELLGGAAEATLLGTGKKVSAAAASFGNTYLGNVLDAAATFLNGGHPPVAAVFPALALAERDRLSGRDLITAVAVGYDAGTRVMRALITSRTDENGLTQRTSQAGLNWYSFVSAATAARALGLDAGQVVNALGLAGWTAPVNFAFRWQSNLAGKNMMKYAPMGFMAFNGVISAQLAESGFTGDPAILDGQFSYPEQTGAYGFDADLALADLGTKWWISETSIKGYSIGRFAHHSVGLFARLVAEHALRPDEIQAVAIETFAGAARPWFSGVRRPETVIDLQFSLPLAVAGIAYGHDLIRDFQGPERLTDTAVLSFADRVSVAEHPAAAAAIDEQISRTGGIRTIPNRITIAARGTTFSADTDLAWGDPWSTSSRMTDDELRHKYRRCTEGIADPERVEAALEIFYRLEEVDDVAADLGGVLA